MNAALAVVPFLVPLLAAGISMLVGRSRAAQRTVSLLALTGATAASIALLVTVDQQGPFEVRSGGWAPPLGIVLVADRLAAVMLAVSTITLLAVLVYAIGQPGAERRHVGFQSAYLVMSAGVALSFLTGDLFTLFVAFEMMLTASYVLITLGGRRDQVRTGMSYVVIGLVASVAFIITLALLYTAAGTVNMVDLGRRLALLDPGLQQALAVLLFLVFGIKAAVFPLFFWLPDSYPTAPAPVTAIFAGLLTKVGIYALIRTQVTVFPDSARPGPFILVIAGLTMVVGVLGAVAQNDVKRILSFHIVSQIGYMVLGLGLFTVAGIAAAVYFAVHQIVVKTALFLTGGLVEHLGGSSRLSRVGNLASTAPVVAVLFLVPALSLAGIPPLSGFVAKFAVLDAGARSSAWAVTAAAVAAAFLTLFSMVKIWVGVFWSPAERPPDRVPSRDRRNGPLLMTVPTAALVVLSLGLGLAGGPLYDVIERAATDLLSSGATTGPAPAAATGVAGSAP
ncbi:MAG: proton-conducting transporter membrane subunit [Acidimicrobiia bacterium]